MRYCREGSCAAAAVHARGAGDLWHAMGCGMGDTDAHAVGIGGVL